jgi:hypothetical protein
MRQLNRWCTVMSAVLLLTSIVTACGGAAATPTPVPAPSQPPPSPVAKSRCGDGICDEVERADPSLCPQDCQPTATLPPKLPSPTPAPSTPTPIPPTAKPDVTKPTGKCGDGICDEAERADPKRCPQDCPTAAITVGVTPARPTPSSQSRPTVTPATSAGQSVILSSGKVARLGDPATVHQEAGMPGQARQANLALILDASGSMTEELPGTGQTKLAVAKDVLAELIPQIPQEMRGTLWIYGHRRPGEPKSESCKDIEQVFPLGPVDSAAYVEKIRGINAIGWTPIADSIQGAAKDLPTGDFNSIILVSDGEETCGGDPCALAEALRASDAAVTVHVVGYAVDDATRDQLQCVAQVSGGSYNDAQDAGGLLGALEDAVAATVVKTILRVEVINPEGQDVHANVYLYKAGTEERASAYVAWQDNAVAPGRYDLLVDTLPWTLYQSLTLPEGSTTIVRIVLGAISVLTPDGHSTSADFYDAASGERLGYWGHEGPTALVPGAYFVMVDNSTSDPLRVQAGETTELVLGSISVLTPDGKFTAGDFYDSTNKRLGYWGHDGPVALVPGTYTAKVNSSTSAPIRLESGGSEELLLGAVRVDGGFEVWDASGTRLGYYADTLLLVPGTYQAKLADGRTIESIAVKAGATTEVK